MRALSQRKDIKRKWGLGKKGREKRRVFLGLIGLLIFFSDPAGGKWFILFYCFSVYFSLIYTFVGLLFSFCDYTKFNPLFYCLIENLSLGCCLVNIPIWLLIFWTIRFIFHLKWKDSLKMMILYWIHCSIDSLISVLKFITYNSKKNLYHVLIAKGFGLSSENKQM